MPYFLSEHELARLIDDIWAVYDQTGHGFLNHHELSLLIQDVFCIFGQSVEPTLLARLVSQVCCGKTQISKSDLLYLFQSEGDIFE